MAAAHITPDLVAVNGSEVIAVDTKLQHAPRKEGVIRCFQKKYFPSKGDAVKLMKFVEDEYAAKMRRLIKDQILGRVSEPKMVQGIIERSMYATLFGKKTKRDKKAAPTIGEGRMARFLLSDQYFNFNEQYEDLFREAARCTVEKKMGVGTKVDINEFADQVAREMAKTKRKVLAGLAKVVASFYRNRLNRAWTLASEGRGGRGRVVAEADVPPGGDTPSDEDSDNDDDDPGPPPKGGDRLSARSDGERHADKTYVNLVRGKPGSTPDPRPSLYGRAYAYEQQESDEEFVPDEATIQKQKEFDAGQIPLCEFIKAGDLEGAEAWAKSQALPSRSGTSEVRGRFQQLRAKTPDSLFDSTDDDSAEDGEVDNGVDDGSAEDGESDERRDDSAEDGGVAKIPQMTGDPGAFIADTSPPGSPCTDTKLEWQLDAYYDNIGFERGRRDQRIEEGIERGNDLLERTRRRAEEQMRRERLGFLTARRMRALAAQESKDRARNDAYYAVSDLRRRTDWEDQQSRDQARQQRDLRDQARQERASQEHQESLTGAQKTNGAGPAWMG